MKRVLLILAAFFGLGILSEILRDAWEYYHPYINGSIKKGK